MEILEPQPEASALALAPADTASAIVDPAVVTPLVESAIGYAAEARSPRTREAYGRQIVRFETWCRGLGLDAMPALPGTVAIYIAACADEGLRPATISQGMSAITAAHRARALPSPCAHPQVLEVWFGITRRLGLASAQKAPLATDELRAMIMTTSDGLLGARDRALLTVGFAGGFRRSELVALEVADVAFVHEGVEVTVRRSKTDQAGKGMVKVIAYGSDPATCPVRLLCAWLERAEVRGGGVFRAVDRHGGVGAGQLSAHAVAKIVKRAAQRAGLDPSSFSGHSLRAGFVTEAKKRGADDAAIMDQTGHRSLEMLRRYHRRIRAWERPASARLGL
ncbi:MAG: site-specific integrase [Sandaracinus sp.]